jgi:acyl-CoA thioesterase I
VWQTVVNDAVRDVGEYKLAKLLRRGIDTLKEQGSDVVLMDLQWFPREDRYPKYDAYRAMQKQVAEEKGISLFPRYEAMKGWLRSNNFLPEEILGTDGFHMADVGYRCLAIRLADGIASEIASVPAP